MIVAVLALTPWLRFARAFAAADPPRPEIEALAAAARALPTAVVEALAEIARRLAEPDPAAEGTP